MNFKILSFIAILILFKNSYALTPEFVLRNKEYITPHTPEEDTYAKPQSFSKSNNLRHKAGSPFMAKGKTLNIHGTVSDLLGNPISGASVKIWQANYMGYYNHIVKNIDDESKYSKYDIDFESTGTSVTVADGEYSFFTIMPGYFGNRTPHIHFLVTYNSHSIETEMFFPDNPRNKIDRKYRSLSRKAKDLMTCKMYYINQDDPDYGIECIFDIKLNIINQQRRY